MSDTNGVKFDPYIFFTGNCREAMTFYKSIFGGELTMQTYAEMPGDLPENATDKIMFSSLTGGELRLLASDSTRTEPFGESFMSLSITGTDEEKLRGFFDKLAEGGKIDYPLETAPWGSLFGVITDKFSVQWMVSIDKA